MATVNDITTRALRLLQVKEAGEPINDDEANDGLEVINNLIDSWALENLMLTARVQHSISFVSGQTAYTIGSGGNFSVTRPTKIANAFVRDSQNADWQMIEINNDQYNEIVLKSTNTQYPTKYYYRPTYPLGTIDVWGAPGSGLTFFIEVDSQFTQFATVSTTVALAPGYVRALEYNLAVELAPEYVKNTTAPNVQMIIGLADKAKEFIKDVNNKNIGELTSEFAYIGRNNGSSYWFFDT